jgi:hypothetical protein
MAHCQTPECKNEAPLGRKMCNTCKSKIFRSKDQVRYFLANLKRSAIKRHIPFNLELEEFRAWTIKENFRFGIKKHGDRDSVDRIRNNEGYHINNIQKLTVSQNSKKYQNHDKKEYGGYKPVETGVDF